jgi:hypothetical protein
VLATKKQHRLLTESEMFSITESTDDELLDADKRLGEMAAQILDGVYEPGIYLRLVKSGAFTASTVSIEGEAKFVLIHTRNALGWLIVEGIASLRRCPLETMFEATDALARHYRSKITQFVSRLSAMGRMAQAKGYEPAGIFWIKNNALPA